MPYQDGRDIAVHYKEQSVIGTPESGTGSTGFRVNSGGMNFTKGRIASGENRRDGMMTLDRHGLHAVAGSYSSDLSIGTFDALFEAALRGTWEPALTITEATAGLTSITTTTTGIVASAGSWITAGLRSGDVLTLDGQEAGNANRNLRLRSLAASTATVSDTLTANAVADTAFTVTRARKLIMGDPPVERAFTIEEREADIDGSEVFEWCRVSRMRVELTPNGMVVVTFDFVGRDMAYHEGGASPVFTDPVFTTSIGLVATEAKIRLGISNILDMTAASFEINYNAGGFGVIGSNLTPDVLTNRATVTGSITGLRQDFDRLANFVDEDILSLNIVCEEQDGSPPEFIAFHLPYIKFASAGKSPLGSDGPRTVTHDLIVGVDERGGAYDKTMVKILTSAS